jgi:hypothetical protein
MFENFDRDDKIELRVCITRCRHVPRKHSGVSRAQGLKPTLGDFDGIDLPTSR